MVSGRSKAVNESRILWWGWRDAKIPKHANEASSPPSMVMISRILGDVEVRYWRCCNELVSGNGAVVSSAVV